MNWRPLAVSIVALAILCETAHVVSPILLAWTHRGLRQIVLSRPIEMMVLPVLAMVGALTLPMWAVYPAYWAWDTYHFGAQHYGVARILGLRVPRWACISGTAMVIAIGGTPISSPLVGAWWMWVSLIILGFNHWLVDIGLSARVSRYWWLFLAAVALIGCAGFAWQVPTATGIEAIGGAWIFLAIKARWGAGLAHFLYSRIWKFSDPAVRAALGVCWGVRQ